MNSQKTTLLKNTDIQRKWHEIDATDKSLGRLASQIATILRGKNKVSYSPHQDIGDFVVVKNVAKIKVAVKPKKLVQKKFHRFSGYPGGLRTKTLGDKFAKDPGLVLHDAVRGMIAGNRLRKHMLRRLKIVEGAEHKYPVSK